MDNSQLNYQTNASSSIWYVLATIAGEPKGAHEANQLTAMNRHYWNGLMADRVAVYGGSYQMTLKREIPFPKLPTTTTQSDKHWTPVALAAYLFLVGTKQSISVEWFSRSSHHSWASSSEEKPNSTVPYFRAGSTFSTR